MKHFEYKRSDNLVSERFVVPIGLVGDKMHAIDLTQFDEKEREQYEKILHDLRLEYINNIKEEGLGTCFRYFFLDRMSDV